MRSWVIAVATLAACATSVPARVVPAERLEGTDGAAHSIVPFLPEAYTAVIFFSTECHVLAVHDERVRKLAAEFAPRGVRFLGVDSEVGATLERDRAEVERRRYPFPVVLDRGGDLARTLGAMYAGYTVVLDRDGNVRYRGGIDSDRVRLRDDATPYLSDALADLLAGGSPRMVESKALGCALRLR
jgi:AhpC/TSA family